MQEDPLCMSILAAESCVQEDLVFRKILYTGDNVQSHKYQGDVWNGLHSCYKTKILPLDSICIPMFPLELKFHALDGLA